MTPINESGAPLPLVLSGDPRLRERSREVPEVDETLLSEASRLCATLRDFRERNGFGRAISAVQAGIPKRMIAMNLGAGPFVLLNPEITWRSEETFLVWDDCLSVPDILVRVRRHQSISLTFRDHRFRIRRWRHLPADLSELVQHEIDHLDGVLMTDRAEGADAIQPLSRWQELVGSGRPASRLSLARIAEAPRFIDEMFLNSPQLEHAGLSAALGARLTLKVETTNPLRNFKGRGASHFMARRMSDGKASEVFACASAGNFGQALAWACRARGRSLVVFAAETANPVKLAAMRALGADVRQVGEDFDAAKERGREWARETGVPFVEDGLEPWITEGAGTIGAELLASDEAFDAILVPLGNGALISGVGRYVKALSPATEVIGVCASGAPAMERAFRAGSSAAISAAETQVKTFADGLAVRIPVREAVADMQGLVDDVLLVDDARLREAMELAEHHAELVLEPSGAAGLAAVRSFPERFAGLNLATILTGANRAPA